MLFGSNLLDELSGKRTLPSRIQRRSDAFLLGRPDCLSRSHGRDEFLKKGTIVLKGAQKLRFLELVS